MIYLYHTLISTPLYNGFILLFIVMPWIDAGIAVIIFTIIVKLILFPLAKKAVITQLLMRRIEPQIKAVREKFKNDQQALARETMALYKKNGVNPFSSFLLLLIQLPILIALYSIFYKAGLPSVNMELLYPYLVTHVPESNINFLGIMDITKASWVVALIAAISQFYQIKLSVPSVPPKKDGEKSTFQEDMARSMGSNMKYVFPVIVFLISYNLASAIALYWVVSNLFMIGQELFVKRKLEAKFAAEALAANAKN